jgi:hypothetical protein
MSSELRQLMPLVQQRSPRVQQKAVPACRFAEGYGKDGAITVNYIKREKHWYL